MIFNTPYERRPSVGESNFGQSMTEKAGYVPANKLIESMIFAGQRLNEYRASQYDFPDGEIDEDFSDPTRNPGFDLADATKISQDLEVAIPAKVEQLKIQNDAKKASSSGSSGDVKVDPDVVKPPDGE